MNSSIYPEIYAHVAVWWWSILPIFFMVSSMAICFVMCFHDDVMAWRRLPQYWFFVKGIHWWLVESLHFMTLIWHHCYGCVSLQWRHNGHDVVSNHQPYHCLLNRLFSADQRKHQSSVSLAFVRGIHQRPVNSPHKWPVTRKMFPFDDVIMYTQTNVPEMTAHWLLMEIVLADGLRTRRLNSITITDLPHLPSTTQTNGRAAIWFQ